MLSHLNSILKSTLARTTPEKVPLSQELELVGNYLAIEQVRFADRLRIEMNVDPTRGRWPGALLSAAADCGECDPARDCALRERRVGGGIGDSRWG